MLYEIFKDKKTCSVCGKVQNWVKDEVYFDGWYYLRNYSLNDTKHYELCSKECLEKFTKVENEH